jgi:hypothetical protein
MNLYLFETSAEFLTCAPTNTQGIPIGNGAHECPISDVQTAHVNAMYNDPITELPDRLSIGTSRFVVMRSSVAETLLAHHRVPSDLRVIPVVVFSKSGKRHLSDDFVLIHSETEFDVLDRVLAEYIAVHRGAHVEVVVNVTKWSVCADAVPPLDLFPVETHDWMVTEAVKRTFAECRVTGVRLTRVNVV